MTITPYPHELRSLTSLRFVAAFWVLLYHFRDHLGLGLGQIGLVAHGWMGVDLFFILSGFILTHVYLSEFENGRFGYLRFLQNRFARIYPMHLAALAAVIALYAIARATGAGVGEPSAFRLADLPQHLLMVHAWATTPTVGWNFPSWSISAEWGAYLLFPLVAALLLSQKARPGLLLAIAFALCLLSYGVLDHLHNWAPNVGRGFAEMTAQIGLLRILPSFLLGAALYAFARARPLPTTWAWPVALASALWLAVIATFGAWPGFAWFGLAGLIVGLAETSRRGLEGALGGNVWVFLGSASYALYMIHLPIDIVYFHSLERLGLGAEADLFVRALALVGVFIASIAASSLAHIWIEEPSRRFIRGLGFPVGSTPIRVPAT